MASFDVPLAHGSHPVAMDPSLANAIGLSHTIQSALADLVDNSLDAGATEVEIRLLLDGERPIGLQVIDDGRGMDSSDLDRAMTYSLTRSYASSDLGHFGVGLKAASLSQADTVLVCSARYGASPVGRLLRSSGQSRPPVVGSVDDADVRDRLHAAGITSGTPGTVVEWRDVRTFCSSEDGSEQRRWVQTTIDDIRTHLGLVFHRLLDRCSLWISTLDTNEGSLGPRRRVRPIDPFGYPRSGVVGYPRQMTATLPDGSCPVRIEAHIWPAKSQDIAYKLYGQPGGDYQGFFVYRRDRLLQAGGWSGLWGPRSTYELARVKIDLGQGSERHAQINPEKSGVTFSSDLARGLEGAVSEPPGVTMSEYLSVAAGEEEASRRRNRRPITLLRAGHGIPLDVRDAMVAQAEIRPSDKPVDVVWRFLAPDRVFEVDVEARELRLNTRHVHALTGQSKVGSEDAPVVKTLFYLLLDKYLDGSFLGPREKMEVEAWNTIVLAAIREQEKPS